jgi:hypothetical protein
MDRTARSVERLRLRADSESAVRRALPALEDAFQTATLPGAGARLVFVRRLDLGRLPVGASAQSLSLLLESRVTAADWTIVHAGEAEPNAAQAVWFRDVLEAHELAAFGIAAGRPLDAWFWPLAVPALAGATSTSERLRALAFSLAALEEAPAALPAWVTSLVTAGHGERLVAALRPGDGEVLLRAAAQSEHSVGDRRERGSARRTVRTNRADADRLRQASPLDRGDPGGNVSEAGHDDRRAFVERLSGQAVRPVVQSAPPVVSARAAARRPAGARADRRPARHEDAGTALDMTRSSVARSTDASTPCRHATEGRPGSAPREGLPQHLQQSARQVEPAAIGWTSPRTTSPWTMGEAEPTAAGGLLFLVPALERLGFGRWCTENGHAQRREPGMLARQVFHVVLSRLVVAGDDPAWQLAACSDDGGSAVPKGAVRDGILRRLTAHDAVPARSHTRRSRIPPTATVPEVWLGACRMLLRRHAHIGLASLVARPARLALTAIHADVFFALNAADLKVRRAGLDIDPGWVPWLGTVITFHFGDRPWT